MDDEARSRAKALSLVLEGCTWLTAAQIASWASSPDGKEAVVEGWTNEGQIFSVGHEGRRLFPGFAFDATGRPWPVIQRILEAYGPVADAWALAAWFHFPNGWLVDRSGPTPRNLAPKECLDREADVVHAAAMHGRSYVA